MSAEKDTRRLACGPSPSRIVRSRDLRNRNVNEGRLAALALVALVGVGYLIAGSL